MHIWGSIVLHPMTFPIADQFNMVLAMSCNYTYTVYGAVLKPTVEDFIFLLQHTQ